MGRSKESSNRKRRSQSKDLGYYTKRHTANTAYRVCNFPRDASADQSPTFGSTRSQAFCDVPTYAQIPYFSWTTYFFNQEYNENSPLVARINALIEFFERNTSQSVELNIEIGFNLDINLCSKDLTLLQKWPSFMEDMIVNPHRSFNCINAAFFEVTLRRWSAYRENTFMKIFRILRLNRINIMNHESINALPHLKLTSYGKLISIGGIVINTGVPKLSPAYVVLACTCGREIVATQEHGTYFVPRNCNVCGNGKFKRLLDSPYQFTKVEQTIQIKDCRPTDQIIVDGAISPNIISVKLAGTLVDQFVPGDKIRVIGIPRITLGAVRSTTPESLSLYIDAISVGRDERTYALANDNSGNLSIDTNIIESIKSEPDVLSLLVKSLCPTVQGHEIIKATLILGLFGGSFECGETRDYVHTLVIGDLGLGKSQLLRACAQVAPKGVYVRGSSMKSLEPSMINVREGSTEDSRLEGGAFTLASEGVCCIDELDKISAQHQSIHSCMEDNRVNITDSEIIVNLEARTSIVGMINPIRKRYDPSKTVVENVNASQELLSRFDLVLSMRDHPDTYRDKLMCDRMLDAHTKRSQIIERTQLSGSTITSESRARASQTLTERLIVTPDESRSDVLPQKNFQMYLHYARMYVKPEISSGPRAVIESFCLQRCLAHKDSVNTERLVRTLVILSQARGKIALRAEISEEDVCDTIFLLEHARSFQTKDRPSNRPLASSSNSNKLTVNKVNQFLNELRTKARLLNKTTFTTDELRTVASKENVTGNSVSVLLSKLNEQGYLLKVSSNTYKIVFN